MVAVWSQIEKAFKDVDAFVKPRSSYKAVGLVAGTGGITLASQGKVEDALPYLRRAYAQDRKWAALTTRLPAAGLLPDSAMVDRLIEGMTTP